MAGEPLEAALDYLREHNVMTLATSGPGGVWAAAVFYASDHFDLFFLSASGTRHVQNIIHNPRVAATIQEDYAEWREIRGIQMEGVVRRLADREQVAAIALYRQKFPHVFSAGATVAAALKKVDWFQLRPDRLYFVDNSRGFGHRDRIL